MPDENIINIMQELKKLAKRIEEVRVLVVERDKKQRAVFVTGLDDD